MAGIDWVIVAAYIVIAIGIGAFFTKRAAQNTDEFFVAGRSLPWFIAGTSIVATTFSTDTPLFVAGMSRDTGISSNWFWWSVAVGQIATVFFFARLWRRTGVVTDLEFVVKRYKASASRSFLRIFKVFFDGILINCTVIASVTLAMTKIMKTMLNISDTPLFTMPFFGEITFTAVLLLILAGSAVLYSCLSGLYGVVYTDLVQFALAMIGCIGLAVIVYIDASKGVGLMQKLSEAPDFKPETLNFFPDLNSLNLLSFAFVVYILVGVTGAAGNGYFVQRLLATRSEKDSFLAFLWFNICHYVLRPWPWIIVGLLSLHYFPELKDSENAFPLMMNKFLPVGLKGIMVASLLAAFMSTIDTLLNWGSSYLVNDLYRPFFCKDRDAKHYVFASRVCMIFLTGIALIVTTKLTSILDAYKYLSVILGGTGLVLIARWYWWRVNAISEIVAIAGSFVVGNLMELLLPSTESVDYYPVRVLVTIVSVTVLWVIVTLKTSKKPDEKTIQFYSEIKVSGPGWRKIKDLTQIPAQDGEFRESFVAWFLCVVFLYSILLGIGKCLFLEWYRAGLYLSLAFISGWLLRKSILKMHFMSDTQ
ncbi:MAG: sodium:solute symporter family protein [Anaerohalosphaeraceae bacterium]